VRVIVARRILREGSDGGIIVCHVVEAIAL
jgi:hypothetical protein